MMEVEDKNKEPGTIVQEIQKGYKMKDRLLRPSLVAVSKKPQKNEEKSEEKMLLATAPRSRQPARLPQPGNKARRPRLRGSRPRNHPPRTRGN